MDECERYDLPISLDFRPQILTHIYIYIYIYTHHIQSIMGVDLMCVTENYDKISCDHLGQLFLLLIQIRTIIGTEFTSDFVWGSMCMYMFDFSYRKKFRRTTSHDYFIGIGNAILVSLFVFFKNICGKKKCVKICVMLFKN